MQGSEVDQQQSVIYLTILIVLEILLFIFTIAANNQEVIMFSLMRLILIIGAHCLKNVTWAAYYTIFALVAALYVFDPVGLWISGRS